MSSARALRWPLPRQLPVTRLPVTRLPVTRMIPLLLVAALLALLTVPLLAATPAQAASYRYWGYYHGASKGAWAFASTGADAVKPADGAVEGWRFAISGDADARFPRTAAAFDTACANTAAVAGKKRVAVYIDFGIAVEAPTGSTPPQPAAACAVVPTAATGAQVLAAVEKVRAAKGLVCGIGGYPATGCGGEVKKPPAVPSPEPKVAFAVAGATATPTATPSASTDATTPASPSSTAAASMDDTTGTGSEASHTGVFVLAAVGAAVVLGGGGLLVARRSRS
jgi:hypothetical protein